MEDTLSSKIREQIRREFGVSVRAKRNAKKISQEELAFRSGLHRTYIGSLERGERNVSIENIFVLAHALECEPRELIPSFTKVRTQKKKTTP